MPAPPASRSDAPAGGRDGQAALLWRVEGPDGRSAHLAGSVHVGRWTEARLPPSVVRAFDAAEVLAVEVDLTSLDLGEVQQLVVQRGVLPPGQTLSQLVSPETAARVPAAMGKVGMPPAAAERLRPWTLWLFLSVMQAQRAADAALPPEAGSAPPAPRAPADAKGVLEVALPGVETFFLRRAQAAAKPVVSLETLAEQVEVFAGLSPETQELLLVEQLDAMDASVGQASRLLRQYQAGDAEALARESLAGAGDPRKAEYFERLVYARNARMARAVEGMLASGRTHFVLVGAAHVVGERGLPALLQQRGFRVTRLTRGGAPLPAPR